MTVDSNATRSVRRITDGTTTYYVNDPDRNTFAGTYVEVTATDFGNAMQGNYVVFRGLTERSGTDTHRRCRPDSQAEQTRHQCHPGGRHPSTH
jgi:hypothetical protein